MRASLLGPLALAGAVVAHGDHAQQPLADQHGDWLTKHMAEEHHMTSWDADSVFTLHDFDGDGVWHADEIARLYGLMDPSNQHVSAERRAEVVAHVMGLLGKHVDEAVSRAEWAAFVARGQALPDMGTGPGHHGDDEYEYEIHHWEKYHDDNTRLEDLTHPEDIEHFKKHEELERAQEQLEAMEKQAIVEANIPDKFRRRD